MRKFLFWPQGAEFGVLHIEQAKMNFRPNKHELNEIEREKVW